MVSGLCDGNDPLIASKLHEAFIIMCICLPQDFVMDFELVVRREPAQEMGIGLYRPGPTERFRNTLS
jgi:hypothetical protein